MLSRAAIVTFGAASELRLWWYNTECGKCENCGKFLENFVGSCMILSGFVCI